MNHPIAIFENHLLQHPKNPVATRRNSKKRKKNSKGDGFEVQVVAAPGPSPSSSLKGGNRTPELTRTLATVVSLRF
jgi:hypothetical protein